VLGGISAQKSYSAVVNSGLTPAKFAALAARLVPKATLGMMRDSRSPRHAPALAQ
jgi:hypothetical protein